MAVRIPTVDDDDNEFGMWLAETIAFYILGVPICAWLVMVWFGAVADDLGWQTYGFWFFYQFTALVATAASAVFYPVSKYLLKIQKNL